MNVNAKTRNVVTQKLDNIHAVNMMKKTKQMMKKINKGLKYGA